MSDKTILDNLFDAQKEADELRRQARQSETKVYDSAEKFLNRIAEDLVARLPETFGILPMFCPRADDIRLRDHSGVEQDYDTEHDYGGEIHFHACIPLSLAVGSIVGDGCYSYWLYRSYLELLRENGYIKADDDLSRPVLSDPRVLAFCAGISDSSSYKTYLAYSNGSQDWERQKAERIKRRMEREAEQRFPGYSQDFMAGNRAAAEAYERLLSKDAYEARNLVGRCKETWLTVCLAMCHNKIEIMARISYAFDPPSNEMEEDKWPVRFTFDNNADVSRVSTRILSLLKNEGEEPREESASSLSPR